VKIYNVTGTPESKIPIFEKIDYKTFYTKLDNNVLNQDTLRAEIREKLKGVKDV